MKAHSSISSVDRSGVTLLELLVAVAIIGVVLLISSWVFDRRGLELTRATSDVQNLLQVSRFEAIRSNQAVSVRFAEDQVFVDANNNQTWDSGERRLELTDYGSGLELSANLSGSSGFRWSAQGLPIQASSDGFAAGNITLSNPVRGQRLCLSSAGRLRRIEATVNCE